MVAPSGANEQQTLQFLSSVLSQRGPSALPYAEDTKWLIRQHLLSLTSAYPSLEPKTATFTHNDGRSVNLLQADGTVPMPFQRVTYNIPVIIWLMESYPRHPPIVYVNPTRDMVIKRPHNHVTPSGLVSLPYLHNWIYPSSNLVDLVRNLSSVFSADPPVFSRRPSNPNPNQPLNSLSHHQQQQQQQLLNYAAAHRPAIPPPGARPYPPSPYGGGRVQPQTHTDDAAEVYKRNAVNKIVETVHGDVGVMRKAREAEMEGMFSAQGVLRRREEEIIKGLKEMRDEIEGLEQQLQVVLMNTDVLEAWVKENEGKSKNLVDFDVDSAFECGDSLSRQLLECTAADLAIEDVVYSLDKAVQDGAVPFDQYLRNVRLLSREQFFHRATAAKVRAAQMQAQVASMAARAPHYVT
ncbi:UEV domain-containing protein/Vps23_core domain-containing protein [Cephalotus follicularis]|uniref:UEV domain-containing protein/Vps23_core domain-containing protein n=1 Tax=Cephalotus follicularis TaxID=3775 RepID=A0A1Q3D9B2_CEPFO|nr:UEV domain-containing protein/Vps23_core domain-containing protein [Cephalotus follicularis]